jgi:hypothetical protein
MKEDSCDLLATITNESWAKQMTEIKEEINQLANFDVSFDEPMGMLRLPRAR